MKTKKEVRKMAAKKLVWFTILLAFAYALLTIFHIYHTKGGIVFAGILWIMLNIENFYQLITGKNFYDRL